MPTLVRHACCLALLLLASFANASAAPLQADLGEGLHYHRASRLPSDLPAANDPPTALILDLRYAAADPEAATAFAGWLKFRARVTAPVFVLVNRDTSSALWPVLAAIRSQPGVMTLGTSQPEYVPDIPVVNSPEAEHRGYAAPHDENALRALLAAPSDKPRTDEASLARFRANLPEERVDDDGEEPELSDDPPPPASSKRDRPSDATLRRAVQVHRALRALKRL